MSLHAFRDIQKVHVFTRHICCTKYLVAYIATNSKIHFQDAIRRREASLYLARLNNILHLNVRESFERSWVDEGVVVWFRS